jgi:transposase
VAAVALAHGLNVNLLRRWVHEAASIGGASKSDATRAASTLATFVQLPMSQREPHAVFDAQPVPALAPPPADIAGEIHRSGTTVHVNADG